MMKMGWLLMPFSNNLCVLFFDFGKFLQGTILENYVRCNFSNVIKKCSIELDYN